MENKIFVQRETFKKNGKEFYTYFIKGQVRGREVRVAVMPPDFGGYTVLDIVFDGANQAELVVSPYEMTDAKGKVLRGVTYGVRSCDDNGEIYECKIKPVRTSDKDMLSMILR